jgi:hypothetical protein
VPLTKCQSSGLTEAARTSIKTSLSLETGFSTVLDLDDGVWRPVSVIDGGLH